MPLLIDGYNLLHATDIFGEGSGPGGFQRSREALLRFVVSRTPKRELVGSTIVFDAAGAPPGLPDHYHMDGLTVCFARNYQDADAMLEELIAAHPNPKSLTVVSSDHRVQRAARQRGAKRVDSDRWYAQLSANRGNAGGESFPGKPIPPAHEADVAYWLKEFSVGQQPENLESEEGSAARPDGHGQVDGNSGDASHDDSNGNIDNPFPPGYGDDLLS